MLGTYEDNPGRWKPREMSHGRKRWESAHFSKHIACSKGHSCGFNVLTAILEHVGACGKGLRVEKEAEAGGAGRGGGRA